MNLIIVNKTFVNSFVAGEMRLTLTGQCSFSDLLDAEKVLELAIQQIQRLRIEMKTASGQAETQAR